MLPWLYLSRLANKIGACSGFILCSNLLFEPKLKLKKAAKLPSLCSYACEGHHMPPQFWPALVEKSLNRFFAIFLFFCFLFQWWGVWGPCTRQAYYYLGHSSSPLLEQILRDAEILRNVTVVLTHRGNNLRSLESLGLILALPEFWLYDWATWPL